MNREGGAVTSVVKNPDYGSGLVDSQGHGVNIYGNYF